jgi:GLPGLI family protein
MICFVATMFFLQGYTQTTPISGKITYVSTVRNSLFLPGVADKIDTTRLYFSDTASVYIIEQKNIALSKADSLNNLKKDPATRELVFATVKRLRQFYSQRFSYHRAASNTVSTQWLSPASKGYCMVDTIPDFGWELLPDTTRMLGILCYKARCKSGILGNAERQYTAWYAPGIPVAYGPGNFSGLPGLILSIDTKYYNFKATAIKTPLRPEEIISINACKDLPVITKKQADQMMMKQQEDMQNIRRLRTN